MALHVMMELGLEVVKVDSILARLFLDWGWLHRAIPDLPEDVSQVDVEKGKGTYGGKFKYTSISPCD